MYLLYLFWFFGPISQRQNLCKHSNTIRITWNANLFFGFLFPKFVEYFFFRFDIFFSFTFFGFSSVQKCITKSSSPQKQNQKKNRPAMNDEHSMVRAVYNAILWHDSSYKIPIHNHSSDHYQYIYIEFILFFFLPLCCLYSTVFLSSNKTESLYDEAQYICHIDNHLLFSIRRANTWNKKKNKRKREKKIK